jgi:hypothetical protein
MSAFGSNADMIRAWCDALGCPEADTDAFPKRLASFRASIQRARVATFYKLAGSQVHGIDAARSDILRANVEKL